MTSRKSLEAALAGDGLRLLGGWTPSAADLLPALAQGRRAAVVWMVAQVGSECWPAFSQSAFFADGLPDPMDRWAKSIGNALARDLGGAAIYPSDGPPYAPFQQWAARAEPLQASPLMLQIHPVFGLWHACRFALALPSLNPEDADFIALRQAVPPADLCLSCAGQPCLSACPVQAFVPPVYDVQRCAGHLHADAGQDCIESGCLARRACPVGAGYRYARPHAAFHMVSFAGRHGGDGHRHRPD